MTQVNKPITEKDFEDAASVFSISMGKGIFHTPKRISPKESFELAKKFAFSFSDYKENYLKVFTANMLKVVGHLGENATVGYRDPTNEEIFEKYLEGYNPQYL